MALQFPSYRDLEFELHRTVEYNEAHSLTPGTQFYKIKYKRLKRCVNSFRDNLHLELPEYKMEFDPEIEFFCYVKDEVEEQKLTKFGLDSKKQGVTIFPAIVTLDKVGLLKQDKPDEHPILLAMEGDRFFHDRYWYEVVGWIKGREFGNLFIPLYYVLYGKIVPPESIKTPENVQDLPDDPVDTSKDGSRDYIVD